MRRPLLLMQLFLIGTILGENPEDGTELDGEASRKILGSSVVTSVSVVMETGNGTKTVFTDAVGRPQTKPHSASELASPIDLLNPDRYEFYTFDDNGDLVKRLMSLEEIKSIIATGDTDAFDFDTFSSNGILPEKRVTDIISNVQNVLKEEMEIHQNTPPNTKPVFDTPDVSDSWSMILPAIFGNSGEDIKPEKPMVHVTPDTIMVEPNSLPSTTKRVHVSSRPTTVPSTSNKTTTKYRPVTSSLFSKTPSGTSAPTKQSPAYASTKPNLLPSTLEVTDTNRPSLTKFKSTTQRPIRSTTNAPEGTTSSRPIIDSSKIPLYKITRLPPRPTLDLDYDIPLFKSTPDAEQIVSISNQYETNIISTTNKLVTSQMSSATKSATQTTENVPTSKFITKQTTTTQKPVSFSSSKFITKQPKVPETTKPITESSTQFYSKNSLATDKFTTKQPTPQTSVIPTKYSGTIPVAASTFAALVRNPSQPNKLNVSTTTEPVFPIIQIITNLNDTHIFESSLSQTQIPPTSETFVVNITTSKPEISSLSPQITSTEGKATTENITSSHISTWIPTSSAAPQANTVNVVTESATTENNSEATGITTFTNLPIREETTAQDDQYTSTTVLDPITSTTNLNEKATAPYDQHLSATELLDQLLQSTNIYEINSELISPQKHIYSPIMTTEKQEESTTVKTESTTEQDLISYPPTTDFTLLQSIEQILSQAVSDVNTAVDPTDTKKIQEMLENYSETNMSQVLKNSATLASDLTAGAKHEEDMTLPLEQTTIINEKSTTNIKPTLDKTTLTERPIFIIANRKSDEEEYPSEQPTTISKEFDTTTENTGETTNSFNLEDNAESSEIINITVISYQPNENKTQNTLSDEIKEKETLNSTPFITTTREDTFSQSIETTTATESIQTTTDDLNTKHDLSTTLSNSETTTLELTTEEPSTTSPISTEPHTSLTTEKITEATKSSSPENSTAKNEIKSTKPSLKPSIFITINENGTISTEKFFYVNRTTAPIIGQTSSKPTKENTSTANPTHSSTTAKQQSSTSKASTSHQEEGNWALVSTVAPHENKTSLGKEETTPPVMPYPEIIDPPEPVDLVPKPIAGFGLEDSTATLDTDIYQFAQLCNELAFGFWKMVTADLSAARSVFVSPFSATSMLAMVFLGARGATSGEMNEILKLDDMVTFNPHLTFKNVSESIMNEKDSDVSISIMIRELFSDKSKGKLLDFYKNRVRAFYDGFVEEASFKEIGDVIRRRTNLLIKKYSNGRIPEFLRDTSITARSPLAGVSANIFQTDCTRTSMDGRDGELHFVVSPSIRQRRLIPIPAMVYKSDILAGYETSLDATAVAIGTKDQIVSTILVIPGQQGLPSQTDSLTRLEKRLVESSFKKGAWSRLLRSLIPRYGIEVQIPRFAHRSIINATMALEKMGLHELFNPETADLRGLNGIANELYLSEVLQINSFATCGEKTLDSHHLEVYPTSVLKPRMSRNFENTLDDPVESDDPEVLSVPFRLRPRQARLPDAPPRLRFDRPFLYFVRHNPTGLILHMGRFNPRLLP